MSDSFSRWFVAAALLVGSLHARETFSLMFEMKEPAPAELYALTLSEEPAPSRS